MPIQANAEYQQGLEDRLAEIIVELSALGGLVDSMENRTSVTISATRMSLLAERKQLLEELAYYLPSQVLTRYSRAV